MHTFVEMQFRYHDMAPRLAQFPLHSALQLHYCRTSSRLVLLVQYDMIPSNYNICMLAVQKNNL